MIEQLFSYLYYLLLAILVFNLTQRKYQQQAEKKRFASLFVASSVLLLMGGGQTVLHFGLPHYYFIAVLAAVSLYLWILREKIFIFRLHCPVCGTRYTMHQVFYEDTPSCRCNPRSIEDVDWESWQAKEEAVLVYIVKDGQVLLIHKKTGLGKGKINAPGGRIEKGEKPIDAAIRETQEETGLTPLGLEERVELSFIFTDGYSLHGRVFFASGCSGEMVETAEADPFWCSLDEIPYEEMWEDDPLWIPRALTGEKLEGVFIFEGDKMLSHRLTEL